MRANSAARARSATDAAASIDAGSVAIGVAGTTRNSSELRCDWIQEAIATCSPLCQVKVQTHCSTSGDGSADIGSSALTNATSCMPGIRTPVSVMSRLDSRSLVDCR